jgi:hypothetical protein
MIIYNNNVYYLNSRYESTFFGFRLQIYKKILIFAHDFSINKMKK